MTYYLGIDPSTKSTGYAVLDEELNIIEHGIIDGMADDPKSFHQLYVALTSLVEEYKPKIMHCETQFIGPGRQTSIKLIRPTGVVLAVAGASDIPFDFINPASWRKTIHGKGKWKKRDTYKLIEELYPNLELQSFNKDNDKTDAIGIARSCVLRDLEETV